MYLVKVGLCGGGQGSETRVLGVPPLPLRMGVPESNPLRPRVQNLSIVGSVNRDSPASTRLPEAPGAGPAGTGAGGLVQLRG